MPVTMAAPIAFSPAAVAVVVAVTITITVAVGFTIVLATITVTFLIARRVFPVVPVVPDKIDPFAASAVFTAMPVPMFGVAGWDAQIDRWAASWHRFNETRLGIDHGWWRETANIEAAIKTGLANVYRDANVGGKCRGAKSDGGNGGGH